MKIKKGWRKLQTKNKKLQLKAILETEGNPNVMEDEVFAGLVGSMRKKGWYMEPATVWEYEPGKYRAISGHKRIQAAIAAGILDTTFRVICDPEYSEEQARLDLMEANHRNGQDDEDLAKRFIESMIDDLDIDIDKIVESTGLSDSEIEKILNKIDKIDNEEIIINEEEEFGYLTFIVDREQKEYIEKCIDQCSCENRTEGLIKLCQSYTEK